MLWDLGCVALCLVPPCVQLLNVTQCPAFWARNSIVEGKDQYQEFAGSTETGMHKASASSTTSLVRWYRSWLAESALKWCPKAPAVPSIEIPIGGAAETQYRLSQRLGFSCHVLRSSTRRYYVDVNKARSIFKSSICAGNWDLHWWS